MLSDQPIFVVGSPRSGTTLMRSILDAHPHIFCPQWETGFFVAYESLLNGDILKVFKEYPTFPLNRGDLLDWARKGMLDLFERFAANCGKTRWAEKTPAHVLHIPLIREVFPKAQFIHMIRNGYEVVRSLQNVTWAPRKIRWSTRMWVNCVQTGRAAGRELPAAQYREVRYEELIREPEPLVRSLCDFLGEPFTAEMLQFHKPEKNSWKASTQPIQDKPLNKYHELGWFERRVFAWMAGPLMRELNYTA
jgi:hypothetical protein